MRKIFNLILLLILSFTLVSCVEFYEDIDYISNNSYEQEIIDTSFSIRDTNVSIYGEQSYNNSGQITKNYTHLSNGVIVKSERKLNNNVYYVLTVASTLESYASFSVSYKGLAKRVSVTKALKNDNHNVAILIFETTDRLRVAKVLNDSNYYSVNIGKTILSIGTDSNNYAPDNIKQGYVTNISNDLFTHDTPINIGEAGSGLYNKQGYLVGLNLEKVFHENNILSGYNVLGVTKALKSNVFASLIKNLSSVTEESNSLDNSLFNTSLNELKGSNDELETKIQSVYNENNKYIVRINNGNKIFSGTIINKENNDYYILTTHFNDISNLVITIGNKEYIPNDINLINDKKLVSILKITTNDTLSVYSNNSINTGNLSRLTRGQYLLTLGSALPNEPISVNVGTLSDTNDEFDFRFMHSTRANLGQVGAPIFNLNGNLIGVNVYKINDILTQTGTINAEGLSYGFKAEDIYYNLNNKLGTVSKYNSSFDYEEKVINSINDVLNKVVTIKTNGGHGSGIIYDEVKNGSTYTYYVLSNEHVVEGASEVTIVFNDSKRQIRAKDYYTKASHDYSIIRFESDVKLDYKKSDVLTSNKNINYTIGQTVIAIGSPEDKDRKGYVTTGNISRGISNYNGVYNLQISHTAQLNPGNSGGALFNLEGELIGINVAKMTSISGKFVESLSISLNLNVIASSINGTVARLSYVKLMPHTKRLGISVVELNDFKNELKDNENPYVITTKNPSFILNYLPETTYGIVVVEVDDLFESFDHFLKYDVIIEAEGVKINDNNDLATVISGKVNKEEPFNIKVMRKGYSNPITLNVKLS